MEEKKETWKLTKAEQKEFENLNTEKLGIQMLQEANAKIATSIRYKELDLWKRITARLGLDLDTSVYHVYKDEVRKQ